MYQLRPFRHTVVASIFLAVGFLAGIAASLSTRSHHSNTLANALANDELKLKAFGAHGNDSFVIASGPVDSTVDGVFCLDTRTGDLAGFVVHPRAGRVLSAFKTNVINELPIEQGKKPAYALTVGRLSFSATFSDKRVGNSLIYVADCNTGTVAVYAFPWTSNVKGTPELRAEPFLTLDVIKTGDVKMRE